MAVLLTLSLALLGEGAPGDLDPTFGVGGIVTTDLGGFDAASAPILQPDGKLVALGISSSGETSDFALARYLSDGSLDATFGVGGRSPPTSQALKELTVPMPSSYSPTASWWRQAVPVATWRWRAIDGKRICVGPTGTEAAEGHRDAASQALGHGSEGHTNSRGFARLACAVPLSRQTARPSA
jgi:hypothetical protein